jgi:hypothetical protein
MFLVTYFGGTAPTSGKTHKIDYITDVREYLSSGTFPLSFLHERQGRYQGRYLVAFETFCPTRCHADRNRQFSSPVAGDCPRANKKCVVNSNIFQTQFREQISRFVSVLL